MFLNKTCITIPHSSSSLTSILEEPSLEPQNISNNFKEKVLMTKNNHVSNRTVGFIDVFAFKTILNSPKWSLEKIGSVFSNAIDVAEQIYKEDRLFDRRMQPSIKHNFSDSIIVYSHDDSEHGSLTVIKYIHRIFQMLLWHQLPVRAAVAFGEAYIDEQKNIHIGKSSFTRAYEIEQAQEWIGGAIDISVENRFPELFLNGKLPEVIQYPIPFKDSPEVRTLGVSDIRFAINWLHNIGRDPSNPFDIITPFPDMFGDKILAKLQNTKKFIEKTKEFYFTD